MSEQKLNLDLSVETDGSTGEFVAAYLRVRKGKVYQTTMLARGKAIADYDIAGKLLGIEILAPCHLSVLDQMGSPTSTTPEKR